MTYSQVQRHEACRVILHGRSEFEAYDCRISGDQVRGVIWVVITTQLG